MTNHIAEARQRISETVEFILPGRVQSYPPMKVQRGLAPLAWVDEMRMQPERVGQTTNVWTAIFPVHIVVDGATHAQCAMLDDLCAQIIDALEKTALLTPRSVEPGTVYADSNQLLRGVVINVAAPITARTFFTPTPASAMIPPEPVPA